MNFDQIKSMDINLIMIHLTFHQNCNFLATHVDAITLKCRFFAIFGRKHLCAACSQNSILKLKVKSKNLMNLRNIYPNMVVFGLELSIFGSEFRIWTWKYRFPKLLIFLLNHAVHWVHDVHGEAAHSSNFNILASKKFLEYEVWSNKKHGHKFHND